MFALICSTYRDWPGCGAVVWIFESDRSKEGRQRIWILWRHGLLLILAPRWRGHEGAIVAPGGAVIWGRELVAG